MTRNLYVRPSVGLLGPKGQIATSWDCSVPPSAEGMLLGRVGKRWRR